MMSDETGTEETEAAETSAPETEAAAEAAPADTGPEDTILRLETEKEEMRGQLLRTLAELDNVRKRAQKEASDARVYAIEKFAAELLNVSDNLARALAALSEEDRTALSEPGKNLLGGIEMTEKELHTVLARNGVTAIAAIPGDPFDPNLHQAVSQVPSPQAPGTIHDVFQTGWKIGDRVLRAAMVAVSAGSTN